MIKIQQALVERRSTFLSSPEWVNLPWKNYSKDSSTHILDIMAEMASVISLGYDLLDPNRMADPSGILGTLNIATQCWEIDAKLSAFYKILEGETIGPLHWSELSAGFNGSVLETEEGCIFPVAFHFPNIKTAYTCMRYWATCSILWSGMSYIYQILTAFQIASESPSSSDSAPPLGFHVSQLPLLEHRTDISILARNICQSVEFCCRDGAAGRGSTICVFPMKVAIEGLHSSEGCERELEWAEKVMDRISGSAARIMKNLGVPLTDRSFLPG